MSDSEYIKQKFKELEELFLLKFKMLPEEFLKADSTHLLKGDLEAEMQVIPLNYSYSVNKEVILAKGIEVKLSENMKNYTFQPLGYSNYFFLEIINSQIIGFGELRVDMDDFLEVI